MIGPIDGNTMRPEPSDAHGRKAADRPQAPAHTPRADRVDISSEGRELAAKLSQVPGLSPERVAEIRQNIADGTYDAPEVLEAVARRLIADGDV